MTLPPDWKPPVYAPAPTPPRAARTKKRVFLSFRAEDRQQVQGLRLLAANPDYDLEFYDESVRVAIDSRNAEYVKKVIREKIARSSVTVCVISALTYTSTWVDWELSESGQKRKQDDCNGAKGRDCCTIAGLFSHARQLVLVLEPSEAKRVNRK
jgi:hypothetical protein